MIRGSCLCGGVAFEIEGEVTPIQFCHATRCRKSSGSAFSPEMLVYTDRLRWTRGEELISRYEAPILSAPPAYQVAFCKTCGSPLPAKLGDTPFSILKAGVLDDDPGTRPLRHAFVAQKADWFETGDELPEFDGRPPPPTGDWNPDS